MAARASDGRSPAALANSGSVSHQSMKATTPSSRSRLAQAALRSAKVARAASSDGPSPALSKTKPRQWQIGMAHYGFGGDAAAHGIADEHRRAIGLSD